MPNPANTFIILKSINKSTLEGNLKIWNIAGELVIEKQIAKTNQLQLDIEQWANGMYIIELAGADKTERFKFIKQQ